MATDRVTFFNAQRGFGLVSREVDGDVSVHFFCVQRIGFKPLADGEGFEFDVVSQVGDQAQNLPC